MPRLNFTAKNPGFALASAAKTIPGMPKPNPSPSVIRRVSAYRPARLYSSSSMRTTHAGHSAEVKVHVVRNGSKFRVAQLGPDFLVLENADDLDGPAEVILCVDGVTNSRQVQLQCGATRDQKTILFR